MKVFALFTVLMLASCHAILFDSIGSFFQTLGQSALDALKETGQELIKNVSSTTANILSETGQLALFEFGNTLNSIPTEPPRGRKRDIGHLAAVLEQEFQTILKQALDHAVTDASTIVSSSQHLVEKLLSGELDPQAVLDFAPRLQGAVHRITADLKNGLFGDLLGLLARHSAKRDLGLLTSLREKLHQFLQPFVQIVEQGVGGVAQTVENLAQNVLTQGAGSGLADLLNTFHL